MKNRRKIQEYFKNRYYNKKNNYEAILSEIKKEENRNKNSLLRTAATIIITLLGTTSIVFASTKIYNEYIKKQDEIDSNELFVVEEGLFSNDFASDMMYEKEADLYYKIITNIEDYSTYKEKVSKLPEMSEEKFNDNFLIIIGNWGVRQPHECDLMISEINVDETTTYITLKQKEKPNYDKYTLTLYAVVDKVLLRNKTEINIKHPNIQNPNFISLDSIPDNYSIEGALKDGCFVEENNKILSENKYALDELIEKSKNGEEAFTRIYSKAADYIRIIDLELKNGIFIANAKVLGNKEIGVRSFKYLTKKYHAQNNTYEYGYNDIDRSSDAGQLLIVDLD